MLELTIRTDNSNQVHITSVNKIAVRLDPDFEFIKLKLSYTAINLGGTVTNLIRFLGH